MSQTIHSSTSADAVKIHKPNAPKAAQTHSAGVAEGISMTAAALAHLTAILKTRRNSKGLRLGVKSTGCSGYSYQVEIIDATRPDDKVFPVNDQYVVAVDPKSYPLVKGTVIDYVRKGLNAHFVYQNPNQAGECGCGESFSVS